jgi:hypothetical protein
MNADLNRDSSPGASWRGGYEFAPAGFSEPRLAAFSFAIREVRVSVTGFLERIRENLA